MPEMQQTIELLNTLNKNILQFQAKNDELEAQVKKFGLEDYVTKAEMKKLEEAWDKIEEKYAAVNTKAMPKIPHLGGETQEKFNLGIAVKGLAHGEWERDFEKSQMYRVHGGSSGNKVVSRKSLLEDTSSGGTYLLPAEYAEDQFIPLLYSNNVFSKLGVRNYTASMGNVEIPKLAGGCTSTMVGYEATQRKIPESNQTINKLIIAPKKNTVLCPVSNGLLMRGAGNVMNIVQQDMARKAALDFEYQFLFGVGTTYYPEGIITNSSVQEVKMADNGEKFSTAGKTDKLFDLIESVESANGIFEAWVMNPRVKSNIRTVKNTLNEYIMTIGSNAGDPPMLLGYPYFTSNMIPNNLTCGNKSDCSVIFGGQWSNVMIVTWGDIQIYASKDGTYIDDEDNVVSCIQEDMTLIRVIVEQNIALMQPTTMGVLKGIRDRNAT